MHCNATICLIGKMTFVVIMLWLLNALWGFGLCGFGVFSIVATPWQYFNHFPSHGQNATFFIRATTSILKYEFVSLIKVIQLLYLKIRKILLHEVIGISKTSTFKGSWHSDVAKRFWRKIILLYVDCAKPGRCRCKWSVAESSLQLVP